MELYLKYSEDYEGGDIAKGQEEESWPNRNDKTYQFTPLELCFKKQNWQETIKTNESFNVGDLAYLVVARYKSGDTFGNSYGHWHCVAVVKSRDRADECSADITQSKDYRFSFYANNKKEEKELEKKCKEGIKKMEDKWGLEYLPWNGYFERLTGVEIYPMRVV